MPQGQKIHRKDQIKMPTSFRFALARRELGRMLEGLLRHAKNEMISTRNN